MRRTLAAIQRPWRERQAVQRSRREVEARLRIEKRTLDAQLRSVGLRLQGFEIRGWRTSIITEALRGSLPFMLRGLDVDNGSEFLNDALVRYCATHGIDKFVCLLEVK